MNPVVFWCDKLEKLVPCNLRTNYCVNKQSAEGKRYYIRADYDFDKFAEFNITKEEVYRYSDEFVLLNRIYPAETQTQIDYYTEVIPNKITTGDHKNSELDRFEAIVNMLCNFTGELNSEVFFNLTEFITFEILFTYCDLNDRLFMQQLASVQLTEQPQTVLVPQLVRMAKTIFNKMDLSLPVYQSLSNGAYNYKIYKIFNERHFSEFDYIPFPLLLNVDILKYNFLHL